MHGHRSSRVGGFRIPKEMSSPTPHRIALCALARYLGTSRPLSDDHDEQFTVREPPTNESRPCTRNLTQRDWRTLCVLLMEMCVDERASDCEPSLRELFDRLDSFSQRVNGAPAASEVPYTSDAFDESTFLEKRKAESSIPLKNAPPVNFADLLLEAIGQIRDVDDLVKLMHDVEPRSKHACSMRGELDDAVGVFLSNDDPEWLSPVDPNSVVGIFLRRCVADFSLCSFEAICGLIKGLDVCRKELYFGGGGGEFDSNGDEQSSRAISQNNTAFRHKPQDERNYPVDEHGNVQLKVDAAVDVAEAAGDAADAHRQRRDELAGSDEPNDGEALWMETLRTLFSPSHVESFQIVYPSSNVTEYLKLIAVPDVSVSAKRAVLLSNRLDAGEVSNGLGNGAFSDNSSFLHHQRALLDKDFTAAEDSLRQHFDYLAAVGVWDDADVKGLNTSTGLRTASVGKTPFDSSTSRKRLHQAVLALANTHVSFGNSEEALKALNETVRVAQQSNDTHALANAVAATAVLSASSSFAIASREGNPSGVVDRNASNWLKSGLTQSKTDFEHKQGSRESAEDHRVLLQRLYHQATGLKDPVLLAFANIVSARRAATRPSAGRKGTAPETVNGGTGTANRSYTRPRGVSLSSVRGTPPALTSVAHRRVEGLRHACALGAAAQQPSVSASAGQTTEPSNVSDTSFYPTPKGLSCDLLPSSAAQVSQLSGSASSLSSAVWDTHGLSCVSRVMAMKHLRLDASKCEKRTIKPENDETNDTDTRTCDVVSVSASAQDTAAVLGQLVKHALREHGVEAASEVLELAQTRFPTGEEGGSHKQNVSSIASQLSKSATTSTNFSTATSREEYHTANNAVQAMASLSPYSATWDSETRLEAYRASGQVKKMTKRFPEAHDAFSKVLSASKGLESGAYGLLVSKLDLADTFLAAKAYAQALPHALAAEQCAVVLRLDGIRAAAIVAISECLLGLDGNSSTGGSFAQAARNALDTHACGVLGKGGLFVRTRARLASGKAALAVREREHREKGLGGYEDDGKIQAKEFDKEIVVPLSSAALSANAGNSHSHEAESYYLLAMKLNAMGDIEGRNIAARKFRRCVKQAKRDRQGER